ncbi:MAG: hypothetical protein K8L99_33445 [Anaerolineae bacterium]|nr:hypothetical protein [Anaerolineae bacterium]
MAQNRKSKTRGLIAFIILCLVVLVGGITLAQTGSLSILHKPLFTGCLAAF